MACAMLVFAFVHQAHADDEIESDEYGRQSFSIDENDVDFI
jgi:hypothetical protein